MCYLYFILRIYNLDQKSHVSDKSFKMKYPFTFTRNLAGTCPSQPVFKEKTKFAHYGDPLACIFAAVRTCK